MMRTIACLLVVTACAKPGYRGTPVPVDQIDVRLREAVCVWRTGCGQFASLQSCEDFFSSYSLEYVEVAAGVASGAIVYDPAAEGDCLDAITHRSCDPTAEDVRVRPDSCAAAIRGQRTEGQPCWDGHQCTSGSCTIPINVPVCTAGTCDPDPLPAGARGEACTQSCAVGNYCDATSHCAALLGEGQTCDHDTACDYGLSCKGPVNGPYVCTKTPRAGDPCLLVNYSRPGCVSLSLACDTSTNTCVPPIGEGGACSTDAIGTECRLDLYCDATQHVCKPFPGDGMDCTNTDQCAGTARCFTISPTQYTCGPPVANGGRCEGSSDCASDFCEIPTPTATEFICAAPSGCEQ